jgi:hypothetical protein
MAYVDALENSADGLDMVEEANFLVFLSDAVRKVPAFADIHNAQREKEIAVWTSIVKTAKNSGEIASELPDRTIAAMFLDLSDGTAMNHMVVKNAEILPHLKEVWDGLYRLLKK